MTIWQAAVGIFYIALILMCISLIVFTIKDIIVRDRDNVRPM